MLLTVVVATVAKRRSRRFFGQKHHALLRFAQRHHISVNGREYDGLCYLIAMHCPDESSRVVKFLCRTSREVTHWAVLFQGEWLPMLYNEVTRRIVTVLPPDALSSARYRSSVERHGLPRPPRTGFRLNDILADKLNEVKRHTLSSGGNSHDFIVT